MMHLFNVLLCVIAGVFIGGIVSLVVIFFAVVGDKFIDFLIEKFNL